MAQGDPRLIGYASAAIAPLATTGVDDAAYWLVRGQLEQYSHQFAPALDSLGRAARLAPSLADAPAWRAAIFMVQARYAEAAAECERLAGIADPLFATGLQRLRAGLHRRPARRLRPAGRRGGRRIAGLARTAGLGAHPAGRDGAAPGRGAGRRTALPGGAGAGGHRPVPARRLCRLPARRPAARPRC
jgi:tetratricopeptide (TPR) repeat protein